MIEELIKKSRSIRRFKQNEKIDLNTLKQLINLARFSPSAANKQPLKFILSNGSVKNEQIFKHLAWAGYLKDWKGPKEGEQPSAYIIICGDTSITTKFSCDHGIAAQSILLGAVEKGYGGCMIGSIQKEALKKELSIPEKFEILLIVALGVPSEEVEIESVDDTGNIEYWRDEKDSHHVPKRSLEDLIVELD